MRLTFALLTSLAAVATGLLPPGAARAQAPADSLAPQLRRYDRQTLTEQLYVHHDRPAYAAGETMWLKVYAVDGTAHRPLAMSKVAYVELLDASQRPVLQAKLALREAVGQGALALPPDLATGRYVLRAYTSWMKNAGPAFYFQAPVTIVNTWQPTPPAAGPAPTAGVGIGLFAEGGQLVAGQPGRVGVQVTNGQGRGLPATGTVADERGTTVATFQTQKGLGRFELTPAAGARYVATVRLSGGQVLSQPLPAAQAQGYALLLQESANEQLTLEVRGPNPAEPLYLLTHGGQQVAAVATAQPAANGRVLFQVDGRRLRPGITHFTVFSGRRPVAERLYFRRPTRAQTLALAATADRPAYGPRQPVALRLAAGAPAQASLAVYRLDSLAAAPAADIAGYLLLAADLPGFIEDAGAYVRDSSAAARRAADNLMLTQGWRRFRWEEVLAGPPTPPAYPPELNGYQLLARVSAPGGAPRPGTVAYLSLPGRAFWFDNAQSRADGRVRFELPDFYGLRKLVLQTNSATADSTARVELLSPFTPGGGAPAPGLAPLPVRWAASLSERHLLVQALGAYPTPAPRLRPVPGDTVAFYGKPSEQFSLDDYTRFPTVEDVLREYVPAVLVRKRRDGFHFMVVDRPRHLNLQENPLTLLDGLPVFNLNQIMAFDPLKIKRLDVMASRYFLGSQLYDGVVSFTTYQGDLGGFPLNPKALIEEYEGLQVPREFYAPRYETAAQQQSRLPDLRHLLYWNPDLRLPPNSSQALNFYTGDQPGRYLVVVQALSASGQPGSTSFTFDVKPTL